MDISERFLHGATHLREGRRSIAVMDLVIVLAVTLLLGAVALVWIFIHWLRTRRTTRDDLRRAGDDAQVTPYEASRRAEGRAAWTRIGGGGG